jgi:ribose-phosphate pyrophosphokinase
MSAERAPVAIQALPASRDEAGRLARRLAVPLHVIETHAFPDGEIRVTVGPAAATTILFASLDHPNDKLIALLFAAEALRRDGCRRIVLIAPYLCYMRQDTAFHDGEAISQRAIGRLLAGTVDRVVTVDAHLHRTAAIADVFPGIRADNLSAMPAIAAVLRTAPPDRSTVVVGPDAESARWVGELAALLGLAHQVGRKTRRGDRSVEIEFADRAALRGRPVLLADDIVSSGGTLITCAEALRHAGAASIEAVITHALYPPELRGAFARAGIHSLRSSCSVPHPTNAFPLDGLFAEALADELGDRQETRR